MNFKYTLLNVVVGISCVLYACGLAAAFFFHIEIQALQALLLEIIFAILFTVFLHLESRPVLQILPKDDKPGEDVTYVHVYVKNKSRWFLFREAIHIGSE
jgi:hypothetical protein